MHQNQSTLIGVSPALRQVVAAADGYARLGCEVVLVGPTGVGKGVIARRIHEGRKLNGSLVSVSGGELHDATFHDTLFGHVRGAYTDAKTDRKGAFVLAAGGSLFLDELPHWSHAAQSALLVPLGDRRVLPMGAERPLAVDTCLLVGTTVHPDRLLDEGRILPDLRYRLPPHEIVIPPLVERRADILPLATWFIDAMRRQVRAIKTACFEPGVVTALLRYLWPGNVRELAGIVTAAVARATMEGADAVGLRHLPQHLARQACPYGDLDEEAAASAIQWALEQTDGNQIQAARLLAIHRNTVGRHRHRAKAGLDAALEPDPEAAPSVAPPLDLGDDFEDQAEA